MSDDNNKIISKHIAATYLRYALIPLDFNQNQKASQWAAQSSRPSSLSSEFFCKQYTRCQHSRKHVNDKKKFAMTQAKPTATHLEHEELADELEGVLDRLAVLARRELGDGGRADARHFREVARKRRTQKVGERVLRDAGLLGVVAVAHACCLLCGAVAVC